MGGLSEFKHALLPILGLACSYLCDAPASALDPQRTISQYKHTRWSSAEGAPTAPHSLTQAPDGHLWMASPDGVFRFDGISFERMDTEIDHDRYGQPLVLLATRRGDIWAWYDGDGAFAVYRNGRFHFVENPRVEGQVIQLLEAPDGAIWAARGNIGRPMLRYHRGHWQEFDPTAGARTSFLSMLVADDGAIWLSYIGNVFRRGKEEASFRQILEQPDDLLRLSADRSGRVWISGRDQAWQLTEPGGRWPTPQAGARYAIEHGPRGGYPLFDRDGSLWIASRTNGLERLRFRSSPTGKVRTDRFGAAEGLTSDIASSILEDREGNIWVSTTRGLNRFRPANVVVEPLLTDPASFGDIVFAASDGTVFVAQASTVYRIAPGGMPEPFITDTSQPEAMCEAPDGTLWIAFADRLLTVGRNGRRTVVERPSAETGIYECGVDRWGRLWLSAAGSGLYHREGSVWTSFPGPTPGPETFYPTQMIVGQDRSLWLHWNMRTLARMEKTGPVRISLADYPDLVAMRHLYPGERGPIITGGGGIGQWRGGRMLLAAGSRMSSLRRLNGVVQTPQGETWGMGPAGIVRVATAELERAFEDPEFVPKVKVLDFHDGLPERGQSQSWRSLVRGGDGRLWAVTLGGTVWVDPGRLHTNPNPPPVAVTALTSDGVRYRDPGALTLPPGTSNLSVRFAALSLAIPERVVVRYMLEGYDRGWTDPGMRREAFYTNLGPGTYRFRVIAANEDGVWNREGATLEFTIPPTFLQSIWFKLLIGLVVAVLGMLAYRLRLRQVTARMQSRFEIRIAERERIARELHDTLLQGIQGLMLRFQAAANRVSAPEIRGALDNALERADAVLVEGRARVRDLRRTSESGELAQRLLDLAGMLIEGEGPRVDLAAEGEPRPLHPLVLEEALRIAEEAIRNVVSHAGAARLDIQAVYGRKAFTLRFRDDGRGISQSVLSSGKRPGHFGLVGMRERAEQIGGELRVTSKEEVGTEVTLMVPARAAYADRRFNLIELLRLERLGGGIG